MFNFIAIIHPLENLDLTLKSRVRNSPEKNTEIRKVIEIILDNRNYSPKCSSSSQLPETHLQNKF